MENNNVQKNNDFEDFLKRNEDFICAIVHAFYEIDKAINNITKEQEKNATE